MRRAVDYIALIGRLGLAILSDVVGRRFLGDSLVHRQSFPIGMRTCPVGPWPDCGKFEFGHRFGGSFLADGRLKACLEPDGIGFEGHSCRYGRALRGFGASVGHVCRGIHTELGRVQWQVSNEGR